MNSLLIYLKQYAQALEKAIRNKENSNSHLSGIIEHNGIIIPRTDELQKLINGQHDDQIKDIVRNLEATVNHMKRDLRMNSEDND